LPYVGGPVEIALQVGAVVREVGRVVVLLHALGLRSEAGADQASLERGF
jgi:hypothetical protein